MPIPYVGRRFTVAGFEEYLEGVEFGEFKPRFVTLHHTGIPSLAQRPSGFSETHLRNMLHYYQNQLGWSGAPHVFVDDRADGIIVFQRLDERGVHARSFNRESWGVEMLGNYDVESFREGRGELVRSLTIKTVAAMCRKLGVGAQTLRFHRDDPKTKKTCPGNRVVYQPLVRQIGYLLLAPPNPSREYVPWEVLLPSGERWEPVHEHQDRPIVPLRRFLEALAPAGRLEWLTEEQTARWCSPGGSPVTVAVTEVDVAGASWALVRDLVGAAGLSLQIEGRTIRCHKA
ncbi:MAG: N-acetylmuramoyl-L-alanine amidase [Armatimonadetes bacterium]|nr:N-acetylmuramoyl-L-alanine amidase [Armatimonadota bacterium]